MCYLASSLLPSLPLICKKNTSQKITFFYERSYGYKVPSPKIKHLYCLLLTTTDYGRPMKPIFIKNCKQFGQTNFGTFGVFLADLSALILVPWVHCPCFPLINRYFYKKVSLYIQIPNKYLGLGFEFEFGLQRIRNLAIVCP